MSDGVRPDNLATKRVSSPPDVTSRILARCRELGFALAGVCRAEPTEYADELRDWLAAGKHGEMTWLAQHTTQREDPGEIVPGAKSIICVADRYAAGSRLAPPLDRRTGDEPDRAVRGRIARYARGDDYHTIMKKRLHALADELLAMFPGETFRACVDTAPVLEREHAQRAGLGAIGKHTLIIEPGVGSYLLLGEIITTLDLALSDPAPRDPCSTCTRCIDACPTDAITPWSVDATKCLSYLTIEHRSHIDPALHGKFDDWLFGCDICQEVCPHNQPKYRTRYATAHPAYAARNESFDLLDVLGWTEDDRRAAFVKSSLKRAKLAMMKRNALIVAGNHLRHAPHPALRAAVEAIASDEAEEPLVRDTAHAVLRQVPAAS